MHHDSDNNVISEPGRFDVETACGTAAIDIGIGRLQNIEWYEARPYMVSCYTGYSLSTPNSIIGIANIISYTVYTYIYIILLPE